MTEKLFWIDPYQREFSANVLRQFPVRDGHAVILDRTCFYATSGGQPNDLGILNLQPVKDVRFENDSILHIVSTPLEGITATGMIDWTRRFDHMQQHTGQHILSAAFYRLFQAETSSFHLGEEYCSIELNRPNLSREDVRKAEELANSVIFGAHPIQSFLVDPDKASEYPLRKQSDLQESLRIVKIADFDLSPCSGTHFRNSGEVGMVFITGTEKLSQTMKVAFLCGNRVAKQYHVELEIVKTLSKNMTTSVELLPETIQKLQDQLKELRKELTQLKEERWRDEADQLYARAEEWNGLRKILASWKRPYSEVRFLAQRLSEKPSAMGALISIPERRAVFFKNPDVNLDLRPIFQSFLQKHSAKGGGPAHFMEAGAFEIGPDFETQMKSLW
jgi:alanyl-tRNA synthetase